MTVSRRRLLMAGAMGLSWTPFGLASCGDNSTPVDPPTNRMGATTTTTSMTTTNTTAADPGNTTETTNTTDPGAGPTPPPGPTPPASGPRIRYDLRSSQGQAMLAIYARGVAAMMALPESDPRSWTFWWYTHFIRDDRSKASELSRIFPGGSSPAKTLASKVWNTCQSHNGQDENFFLPWHRMFVLALENVIRQVTAEPNFTLPYWSYTDSGNAALPSQFRQPSSAQWGSLYRPNRTGGPSQGVNAGAAIQPAGVLNLDSLGSPTYAADGADQGFCANIDGGLHGAVHVGVGDANTGMGSVPWAASDPIFWVHHSNIDRIWASWNSAGGVNPTESLFVSKPFAFAAPSGGEVDYIVGNMLSTAAAGYAYDHLEGAAGQVQNAQIASAPIVGSAAPQMQARMLRRSSPTGKATAPAPTSAPSAAVSAVARLQGVVATPSITHIAQAIRLGAGSVRVTLNQAAQQTQAVSQSLPAGGAVLRSLRRAAPPMVGATAPSLRAAASAAPAPTAPAAAAPAPAQTMAAPGPGQRALLVLNGIDSDMQPGAVYGVYLEAPTQGGGRQKILVGALNFFSAMGAMRGMSMPARGAPARSRAVSFDITAVAQQLAATGRLEAQPQLSFAPLSKVNTGATPTVRTVSLAIQ